MVIARQACAGEVDQVDEHVVDCEEQEADAGEQRKLGRDSSQDVGERHARSDSVLEGPRRIWQERSEHVASLGEL